MLKDKDIQAKLRKSDEREAKLRKLDDFRRSKPHCSASALSAILLDCKENGIPELHSRQDVMDAAQLDLQDDNEFGPILVERQAFKNAGTVTKLWMVNPLALLHIVFTQQGSSFADLMQSSKATSGGSSPEEPWRLVVYADEIVPGNPLANVNHRKIWVIYFAFLEFGALALQNESAWLPLFACPSDFVKTLSAGISQCFAIALSLFFGELGHDLSTGGMYLNGFGRLWACLGMILQDGGAHKLVWCLKGDSGMRFCMFCLNLYTKASEIVDQDTTDTLVCSLCDESAVILATDQDVKDSIRRLARDKGTEDPKIFKKREVISGFNYEPHSLLFSATLDRHLMPITQYCHDWMHAFLVHGILNVTLWLVLNALQASKVVPNVWAFFMHYFLTWNWPKSVGSPSNLAELFSKRSSCNRAKQFKASASELLNIYPVVALFIANVALPAHKAVTECQCFLALVDVIEMLQATTLEKIEPDDLRAAIDKWYRWCRKTKWQEFQSPKWHWPIHLPCHLGKWGFLPSCFAHERKHKVLKRYGNDVYNTTNYAKSIYKQMLKHILFDLRQPGVFSKGTRLIDPRPMPKRLHRFLEQALGITIDSAHASCSYKVKLSPAGTCSKTDVVMIKVAEGVVAAEVWMNCEVEGICMSLVNLWLLIKHDKKAGYMDWEKSECSTLVQTKDIICPVIFSVQSASQVRTIIPWQLRFLHV